MTNEIILGINIKGKIIKNKFNEIAIEGFKENNIKIKGRNNQNINNFHLAFKLEKGLNKKLKFLEIR